MFQANTCKTLASVSICFMLQLFTAHAASSELTYQPINPSFGGNPLNGSVLMQSAESQNTFKDPNAITSDPFAEDDPLTGFSKTLNRMVLNVLSQRILTEAFGQDGLAESGIFSTDDFTVEIIASDPDAITVILTDPTSANSTTIQIPRSN